MTKGYYEPADDGTPASHDDETLLRYLRARKWIPQDAFGQFKDTEDWRQENELDNLYETIDVQEYETTRRLYPQWTGRRDKRGIPVYVFEVAGLKAKEVTAYQNDEDRKKDGKLKQSAKAKVPRKMMRLFALYENLCRFVLPLCSAIPDRPSSDTPVSQSSNIVDISKVGLKQFWNLRAHLQDSSALATAHYPETLDRIFVIGAPSFFPTVWDWAKGWFDPITVQKIKILGSKNVLSGLQEFIDIDNIPKKYGGNLEWGFGDMPFLEPKVAEAMKWKEDIKENGHRTFPIGPVKWEYNEDGDLVAVAIGTENGAVRHRELAGLHPEAGVARLALSPGRQQTKKQVGNKTGAETQQQSNGSIVKESEKKAEKTPEMPATNGTINATAPAPLTAMDTVSKATRDPDHDLGKSPDSHVPDESRAGTYTVPYRDSTNDISAPPEDANRQGTSSTKFEQQDETHAAGQMAEGTPATRTDGQGTTHAVMEPRTVGQAPKDTPLNREVEEAPTMVEQAQEYVASAQAAVVSGVASVASVVGLGGGEKKDAEEETEAKKSDPRVDSMEQSQVEEMLRDQTRSLQNGKTAGAAS